MKKISVLVLLLSIVLFGAVACTGGEKETAATTTTKTQSSTTVAPVPGDEEFLETALKSLTGLDILEVRIFANAITISYEQITDDTQAILLKRWLDLATVTISFTEEPQTITIIPVVEGSPVSEITIEAGDVASLLTGEISLQEALSRIKIEEPG